jgi:hypothetical protein
VCRDLRDRASSSETGRVRERFGAADPELAAELDGMMKAFRLDELEAALSHHEKEVP